MSLAQALNEEVCPNTFVHEAATRGVWTFYGGEVRMRQERAEIQTFEAASLKAAVCWSVISYRYINPGKRIE